VNPLRTCSLSGLTVIGVADILNVARHGRRTGGGVRRAPGRRHSTYLAGFPGVLLPPTPTEVPGATRLILPTTLGAAGCRTRDCHRLGGCSTKKASSMFIAIVRRGMKQMIHAARRALQEHDDEVLPRELIAAALVLSAAAIVLGLNADDQSAHILWRMVADGFVLNVLSNVALVGPSLVIANIVVARWRRRRQLSAVMPALDRLYGVADAVLGWSDRVWIVLHSVDLSVAPDPISFQAPAHDGRRTRSARSLEDQIELINTRSHTLCGVVGLFDISRQPQHRLEPGALPGFMYGFGASLIRDGVLQADAALGKATHFAELTDRVARYEQQRRDESGFADIADSAGSILEAFWWILRSLQDGIPSHLRYLLAFDFEQVHQDRNKELMANIEHTHPQLAAQIRAEESGLSSK
jgi:hypothetical protein